MKKMTCRECYGVCDMEFQAETAEEMMQKSAEHGMAMKDETAHKAKMDEMSGVKGTPAEQQFMGDFQKKFEAAPDA